MRTVLSLFDGISCGQLALQRAGIPYERYYASEIDKYAIQVTQHNHPNTIQIGDALGWESWDIDWSSIDLLFAGFPCQSFSLSGKQKGVDDPRGQLVHTMMDVLNHVRKHSPNVLFLFENVRMKPEHQQYVDHVIGCKSIFINSNLVSAQNRNRQYWTNIPNVVVPQDRKITWGDIRQYNAQDKYFYSERGLAWIDRSEKRRGVKLRVWADTDKCQMIEASHHKGYSNQRFFGIEDGGRLRYITPVECARAQTLPDGYCSAAGVSDTQQYRQIGNGWTVDVIAHILSGLKTESNPQYKKRKKLFGD